MPDIVIDFADRQKILDVLPHTRATIWDDKGIKPHNTGVYFTDVPRIPGTDQSAFDHKVADELGYFEFDLQYNFQIYHFHLQTFQEFLYNDFLVQHHHLDAGPCEGGPGERPSPLKITCRPLSGSLAPGPAGGNSYVGALQARYSADAGSTPMGNVCALAETAAADE